MSARVDHVTVSGTFSLDGQTFDVDNNVWILGDEDECVIVDAPHDIGPILELVGERKVLAILATHAHDDHVRVAPDLADATAAPILLHPADLPVWDLTHPVRRPDGELTDRMTLVAAGTTIEVLHTPGHAPGACCFYVPDLATVFTGDTLFKGGPGATGRSFSDYNTILNSIRRELLVLPEDTVVHTGHGPSTTIGAETATLAELEPQDSAAP